VKRETDQSAEPVAGHGAAVVVHFGSADLTRRCLRSLGESYPQPGFVVVVDNDAAAGVFEPLDAAQGLEITVVDAGGNRGFAGGVNLGVDTAISRGASWCWLVNNDAIVLPDGLGLLLAALRANPSAAMVGSYIARSDGRLWFGGGHWDHRSGRAVHEGYGLQVTEAVHANPGPSAIGTSWITGCSLLFRSTCFGDRGPFDEHLFLYKEELDWQLRSHRPGQAILVPRVLVVHDGAAASGGGRSRVETTFMARNQLILAGRQAGRWYLVWLATLLWHSVVGPAGKGHFRRARWSLDGMRATRTPPHVLLARIGAEPGVRDVDRR